MNAYTQLAALVLPLMTAYQTDLTEHDKRDIESKPDLPFVHVTREMSTHIYFKPEADWLDANAPQKYIFATSTPREIVQGNLNLLETYFNDSDTFHISDGLSVIPCSRDFAISTYKTFLL